MKGYCNICKKDKRISQYDSYIDDNKHLLEIVIYSCGHTKKYIDFDEV